MRGPGAAGSSLRGLFRTRTSPDDFSQLRCVGCVMHPSGCVFVNESAETSTERIHVGVGVMVLALRLAKYD